MAFICMFFPAIVLLSVRRKVLGIVNRVRDCEWLGIIFEYTCCCIFINVTMIIFLFLFRNRTEYIYDTLNASSVFAVKYLLSSLCIACGCPFLEKTIRSRADLSVEYNFSSTRTLFARFKDREISVIPLYLTAIVLLGMHFLRIFDNIFWYDEVIPLHTMRMGWSEMLHEVARWGHTPLHYILIWIARRVFGEHGSMYHFISLLPYIGVMILAITVIRRWFGKIPAFVLVILSSLLENSIRYNVEVRMYSWCQLFILLASLAMYQIIFKGGAKHYLLMAICSLGAVYSHSFSIAPVAILYLSLLLIMLAKRRKSAWKVVISGISVPILFLPWLFFVRQEKGEMISHYELEPISTKACVSYIFFSKHSLVILFCFFAVLILAVAYGTGILHIEKDNEKVHIKITFSMAKLRMPGEVAWLLALPAATFGTIFLSQAVSRILYPITQERYLYPSMILAWLAFGICISKCRGKRAYALLLAASIFVTCIPSYCSTVKREFEAEGLMEETLDVVGYLNEDDYIVMPSTGTYLAPYVMSYYFPQAQSLRSVDDHVPDFCEDKNNWLFAGTQVSEEQLQEVKERGYRLETIVENGEIGTYRLWIYKAIAIGGSSGRSLEKTV